MSDAGKTASRVGCVASGCLAVLAGSAFVLLLLLVLIPMGFRAQASSREIARASDLAPETGRYVRADDVGVYIQEHGLETAPVVLLVPGTSAWSGTWRDTQKALAIAGYRVVAMDLPPFGFSQRPSPARYDRPKQAQRILGVLDALDVDSAVLVGHSFGGGPTLEAALLAPERVKGLVLVDAAISLDGVGQDAGWMTLVTRSPWIRELAVASTFQNPWMTRWALQQMIHDPADATDDRIALYQQPFGVKGTTQATGEWLGELMSPNEAAWSLDPDKLQQFDRPVLLVWGEKDEITPPEQAEQLWDLLKQGKIEWLPDVGHIPQVEDPDALHAALLPFLERVNR